MGRVVDSSIDKTSADEVRARVVNPAGNVGEGKATGEDTAIAEALKDADRKGTENDEHEEEDEQGDEDDDEDEE
jgi:hypothetical protein